MAGAKQRPHTVEGPLPGLTIGWARQPGRFAAHKTGTQCEAGQEGYMPALPHGGLPGKEEGARGAPGMQCWTAVPDAFGVP